MNLKACIGWIFVLWDRDATGVFVGMQPVGITEPFYTFGTTAKAVSQVQCAKSVQERD
jgi:hypothetical protein